MNLPEHHFLEEWAGEIRWWTKRNHVKLLLSNMKTILLVDTQTGQTLAEYKPTSANKRRARRRAEKLDMDYGAYRYSVKIIWE